MLLFPIIFYFILLLVAFRDLSSLFLCSIDSQNAYGSVDLLASVWLHRQMIIAIHEIDDGMKAYLRSGEAGTTAMVCALAPPV